VRTVESFTDTVQASLLRHVASALCGEHSPHLPPVVDDTCPHHQVLERCLP
jgi:hypothetical protein